MATRRRRPTSSRPASATSAQQQQQQQLVMVVVVMDVRDESTFSSADAHNFTDLNQTERCDRDSTRRRRELATRCFTANSYTGSLLKQRFRTGINYS